jgi:hypothetical protein
MPSDIDVRLLEPLWRKSSTSVVEGNEAVVICAGGNEAAAKANAVAAEWKAAAEAEATRGKISARRAAASERSSQAAVAKALKELQPLKERVHKAEQLAAAATSAAASKYTSKLAAVEAELVETQAKLTTEYEHRAANVSESATAGNEAVEQLRIAKAELTSQAAAAEAAARGAATKAAGAAAELAEAEAYLVAEKAQHQLDVVQLEEARVAFCGQKFTLEDAIGSHACSLQPRMFA